MKTALAILVLIPIAIIGYIVAFLAYPFLYFKNGKTFKDYNREANEGMA